MFASLLCLMTWMQQKRSQPLLPAQMPILYQKLFVESSDIQQLGTHGNRQRKFEENRIIFMHSKSYRVNSTRREYSGAQYTQEDVKSTL